VPQISRLCHKYPGCATNIQAVPQISRLCHKYPGCATSIQAVPQISRLCHKYPGCATSIQAVPQVSRLCHKYPGCATSIQAVPQISRLCHKYSVPPFNFRCTLAIGKENRTSTYRYQNFTPHCSSDGNRWLGYCILLTAVALYICCSLHVKLFCSKIFNLSADSAHCSKIL